MQHSHLLKVDASGSTPRNRQIHWTSGQQIYGVDVFPFVPKSGAGAFPSLGKQKLRAWLVVDATTAIGLILKVASNDIFRLQQLTFSLVMLLLERNAE